MRSFIAISALILPLSILLTLQIIEFRTASETAKPLNLRTPAGPAREPQNTDLAMMFWLEEQIAAYVQHLDRETVPETRRQLQIALDQSRAELAKRAARLEPRPHQAKPAGDDLVSLDQGGR